MKGYDRTWPTAVTAIGLGSFLGWTMLGGLAPSRSDYPEVYTRLADSFRRDFSIEVNLERPTASADTRTNQITESPGVTMPMVVEAYDGGGSGLGVGLLIGALGALVCVAIVAIVGVSGATPELATGLASSSNGLWMWAGGLLGATVVLGLIGLFIGKASE